MLLFLLDIDECLEKPCHQNATCLNRLGYHNCSCNDGFRGNGFECEGNFVTQKFQLLIRLAESTRNEILMKGIISDIVLKPNSMIVL